MNCDVYLYKAYNIYIGSEMGSYLSWMIQDAILVTANTKIGCREALCQDSFAEGFTLHMNTTG